jgi:general secretion pathway protein D
MESMLRLTDGETAVMGGLMSDEINNNNNNVPGLSRVPGLSFLFSQRQDTHVKKELVIFLKPTIIRDPSLRGDFSEFAQHLPGKDFFANNPGSLRPADRGAAAP